MSDGERVALYLIGHTLLVDQGATILVDEPEIHIHESIQGLLWNALGQARPDCSFIYITHDLNFASSRRNAVRVLLTEYQKEPRENWTWEIVGRYTDLPEALVLELLGSRRPTLFVEGDLGSLDQRVYETLFPKYYVRPVGGCSNVIDVVTGFRKNPGSHHLEPVGIIDPDDREPAHLSALAAKRIFALGCSQVENLLVQEPVVRAVAAELRMDQAGADGVVAAITAGLLAELSNQRATLVFNRASALVRSRLSQFKSPSRDRPGLSQGMADTVASADVTAAFSEAESAVDGAVRSGTLTGILDVFRNKAVMQIVAQAFHKPIEEYVELAIKAVGTPAVSGQMGRVIPAVPVVP